MVAALQAWADAGLEDAAIDKTRLGVAVATGIGGVHTLLSNYDALKEKGPRRVSPLAVPMLMPNAPAANISLGLGRSEEHTSELQPLMRISYAVISLNKKRTSAYCAADIEERHDENKFEHKKRRH